MRTPETSRETPPRSLFGTRQIDRRDGNHARIEWRAASRPAISSCAPWPPNRVSRSRTGPRIGITRCADWPLRFYMKDNQYVSR